MSCSVMTSDSFVLADKISFKNNTFYWYPSQIKNSIVCKQIKKEALKYNFWEEHLQNQL